MTFDLQEKGGSLKQTYEGGHPHKGDRNQLQAEG